jgi:hypothetical protein
LTWLFQNPVRYSLVKLLISIANINSADYSEVRTGPVRLLCRQLLLDFGCLLGCCLMRGVEQQLMLKLTQRGRQIARSLQTEEAPDRFSVMRASCFEGTEWIWTKRPNKKGSHATPLFEKCRVGRQNISRRWVNR